MSYVSHLKYALESQVPTTDLKFKYVFMQICNHVVVVGTHRPEYVERRIFLSVIAKTYMLG